MTHSKSTKRSRKTSVRRKSARRITQSSKTVTGGKSNRYIEPQIFPKNLPDGIVAKGKDKQFWQIKNGVWVKPSGVSQIALKKIYYLQLKKNAEGNAKKNISRRKSKSQSLIKN